MSFKERVDRDRSKVFINLNHFGSEHTWDGIPFPCVTDEETALKRKNNNVNDISWDNNTMETVVYVRMEDWPGRRVPNEHGWFDNRHMKIMQIQEDMGILTIVLSTVMPKAVASE